MKQGKCSKCGQYIELKFIDELEVVDLHLDPSGKANCEGSYETPIQPDDLPDGVQD